MFARSASFETMREYGEDVIKSIVAFANTLGGSVYIGIDEDGSVVGLPNAIEVVLKVSNAVRDEIRPDASVIATYGIEKAGAQKVVKIAVRKGAAPPYYLAGEGMRPEGVYIREGASTIPAAKTIILKMIRETGGDRYEELRALNQDLTFNEMEKFFKARNAAYGLNMKKALGLTGDDLLYTNLGHLLSDQCTHSVRLAAYDDDEKQVLKNRREFTGSLLKQYAEIAEYLDRHNRVRADFSGKYRTERRDYPEEAVRSALAETLASRDYSFGGSTLINLHDDRLEFVSAGGMVPGLSLDDLLMGLPAGRNEKLAAVFNRLKLFETNGSCLPLIVKCYEKSSVAPVFTTSSHALKISLPNQNLTGDTGPVSANEQKVMALFQKGAMESGQDGHLPAGTVTRKDIEQSLGVSRAMASRLLAALAAKGLVMAAGGGRSTRYVRGRAKSITHL